MFSSTLMIPIRDATETLGRLMPAAAPAGQTLDDITRARKLCQQLRAAKAHVIGDDIRAEIDPDFLLDSALEQLKTAARALRRETVAAPPIAAITSDIYTAANQLQWEISEHDVDYAPRKSGYVAHSAQESDEVLDRILQEK